MKKNLLRFLIYFSLPISATYAQDLNSGSIHGNFQIDVQSYNPDSSIGAPPVPEKLLMNSFANIIYTNGNFSAGVRYESYLNPLQGFDKRYKGSGIPYRYATYKKDGLEVTAGSYYEQFGSGLILRSYEERSLGIDNALDGIRLKYSPFKGIYLKAIYGKQRYYFVDGGGPGIVRGGDVEAVMNEVIPSFAESKTRVTIGGSVVSKYQAANDPIYNLPENVAAFAGRTNISRGKVNIGAEFAYKANDPSYTNGLIYKDGNAALITASYSQKGLGISLAAKRIDNMSFRSDRNATVNDLQINYLPATTKQHTYALAAFYPYATQPNGEFGYQAEVVYTIPKGSKLGGKYGTSIAVNYSIATSIDKSQVNDSTAIGEKGTLGYKSNPFKMGNELYFQDFNIEIGKKINKDLKLTLTYLNLIYNKAVIQVGPYPTIYSHIAVLEIQYKLTELKTIRTEIQHLYTEQDMKNWALLLVEYSVAPHYFAAIQDQYNYGNDDPTKRIHYYNVSGGYTTGSTRFALGYGKQRAGIFCVGGVCRNVPASNGITLSITSSF